MKKFLTLSVSLLGASSFSSHAALIHRYSFGEGSGAAAIDSVGGANGAVLGAGATWGAGALTLPGGSSATQAYVDLPNGLISSLTDVTFEGWFTNNGTQAWGRVFDFGSSDSAEVIGPGGGGTGTDYILLAANRGTDANTQRLEIRNEDPAGGGINTVDAGAIDGGQYHFAVVFDADGNGGTPQFSWYRDSTLQGTLDTAILLSDINDVNNWLGRSNWTGDANVAGTYDEFRIHDSALSAAQVATSFARGADVVPEPAGIALLGLASVAVMLRRRRK